MPAELSGQDLSRIEGVVIDPMHCLIAEGQKKLDDAKQAQMGWLAALMTLHL
jgi:hypothetical protein